MLVLEMKDCTQITLLLELDFALKRKILKMVYIPIKEMEMTMHPPLVIVLSAVLLIVFKWV
jgi:hypothetical protein